MHKELNFTSEGPELQNLPHDEKCFSASPEPEKLFIWVFLSGPSCHEIPL